MAHEPASEALTGSTWTVIATFASDLPKGVVVKNLGAASADIFITPMHGVDAPTDEDGFPLASGEQHSFFDAVSKGGDGLITGVYGKSSGATVHVAVDVR